ncbi:MAG: hypothetical protein RL762_198 [Bacteroidota bacterium]|jgi:hypothetical protein
MKYALVVSDKAKQQLERMSRWFFDQAPGLEKKFYMNFFIQWILFKKAL